MNQSFTKRVFGALTGIQGRLTLISLLFALIPMTVVGVLVFLQARQTIQDQIGQNLVQVVESVGTEVLRYMKERTGDVQVMAQSETLTDIANSPATKAAYLRLVKETYGAYSSIYVTYANGFIQASTDDTTGDQSNTTWYTKAVASGLNVSDVYFSNAEQRLVLTIASPFYDKNERFLGVVIANVDAQNLINLVASVGIGQEGELFLVNDSGQDVVDKGVESIFKDLTGSPAVQRVLQGETGTVIGESDDGEAALLAYAPLNVDILHWHGVAALPLAELNASTDALAVSFAGLAALVTAIIAVLIFFVARAIVRPIVDLTNSATIISKGNLDTPINVQSDDEVGQLANAFRAMTNQVQELVTSLETRVEARTRDLATTIEVGRLATTIYSEHELLPRLVEFIRAKFDLYYTQIYLLDEAKTFAVLRAGSGEVGKQLLSRQHRLNMAETSLVARSVQTRQPIVVSDTEKNLSHRKNPLLPDTRSEAAVPLMIGQEVLGVLDLQAARPGTFNDENAPVFQAMANQIASVLRATQAFDEAQIAVFQAEQANRRLAADMWQDYFDERLGNEGLAYAYDLESPKSIPVGDEGGQEFDIREVQPITILGQEVGRIIVKDSPDGGGRRWSDDQRDLVRDVAQRVSVILEQYRAFDETEAALDVTRRQTRSLTLLNELSKEFNLATTESDIYQILTGHLKDIVAYDHLSISFLQDEKIVPYIVVDNKGLIPTGVTFPINNSNAGKVIAENWLYNEPDLDTCETLDGQYLAAQGYRSSIHIPMTLDEQTGASIDLARKHPDAFDDNAENLLLQVSLLLASALQNRRFLDQINTRALELGLVAEVGAAVTQIRDQDELLFTVSNLTKAVFDLYHAHIYLVDDSGENLVLAAGAGEVGRIMRDQKRTIALSNSKSIVARAGRERQPIIVNRVRQTPDFLPHPLLPETESELAVPMIVGDQLVGVLDVQDNHPDRFNAQQAQVQETLANQIAVAVENARAFQRIESTQAELLQSQTLMADLAQFQSAILDNAEYSIISTTTDGTITSFNRSAEKMLGYAAEDVINKTSPAILHDLDEVVARTQVLNGELPEAIEPGFITFIAKSKLTGQADVNEWTYIRKDGTRFPVELAVTPIYNASREITGYLGIAADITARKEQETAIEIARQDAETLYQVSTDINAADNELAIITAVAEHNIYPATRHVQMLIPLYDDNQQLTAFRVAVEWYNGAASPSGLVLSLEDLPALVKLPQQDIWTVQDFAVPSPDIDQRTQRVMLNLNNRSLTALRLAIGDNYLATIMFFSEKPYQSTERVNNLLRAAAEGLSSSVSRLQLSQQTLARASELEAIAQVTAATTTILDLDELLSSVVELTKERFNLYHAHIYLMDDARDNLVLSAGAGEAGRIMKNRGHKIPIMRQHSLVARAAREGIPVISHDVMTDTDFLPNPLLPMTRSELALPMIVAEVLVGVLDLQSDQPSFFSEEDARVKASLADLIAVAVQNALAFREQVQTAERLREVDKLKSQFLANMSHELRTPLNAIIGYAEVLLDGLDGDLNEEATEDVEAIHGGGKHLLSIINDILDLAKIEAGQMFMHRGKADLLTAVKDGVNTCSIIANSKGVQLLVDAEGELPPIYADPLRTKQIIINLVNNAIKFTEKGSVTVHIHKPDDGMVTVDVVDTGIGMTPNEMGGLFQQFHQVDGSPTRRAGGTGLGLVITKHLVNMHGGDVKVTSEKGVGSVFTFTMPVYSEELEQAGQPA